MGPFHIRNGTSRIGTGTHQDRTSRIGTGTHQDRTSHQSPHHQSPESTSRPRLRPFQQNETIPAEWEQQLGQDHTSHRTTPATGTRRLGQVDRSTRTVNWVPRSGSNYLQELGTSSSVLEHVGCLDTAYRQCLAVYSGQSGQVIK